MASRESQGLQIAILLFVGTTIVSSIFAFVFFNRAEEERSKIAEKDKAKEAAITRAIEAEDQVKELKRWIGAAAGDSLATIKDLHEKDFKDQGAGLAAEQQNYRQLVQQLTKTLAEAQSNLIAAQEREKKLNDKITADEIAKTEDVKKYTGLAEESSRDLAGERGKFNTDRTSVTSSKDDLQRKFDARRKDFDEIVAKLKTEVADREGQIVKLIAINTDLKNRNEDTEKATELADGAITWVNQGERLIWVNRGSADGLRQLVSFEVVDAGEVNPAAAKSKGSIEIIRVTGPHMAEARIISDDPRAPLMPGDIIYSTAWQPGRTEHFALAGFMDINGDGNSDRELVKRIIELSGGVVDAEVSDTGALSGDISIGTKYLIVGKQPTDKSLTPEMQKNYSRMIEQAEKYSIKKMSVDKFLDYTGHRPDQRTVALDKNARPEDFKARQLEIPRKSMGKPIDFAPVRPPQKNPQH